MKYLIKYGQYTDQDLKRAPHEYKSDPSTVEPTYWDVLFDVLPLFFIKKMELPDQTEAEVSRVYRKFSVDGSLMMVDINN